ncbi:MAG: T9SS type A sorting domain-containing protein [Bacteroidetes bacterium]|nr:T9SS type A sorting domain-containing protein [Bacteroidota bacterium]
MKKILFELSLPITLLFFSTGLFGQNDTLFFMDFQIDPSAAMAIYPEPGETDSIWVNYDEDGLSAAQSYPSNFFYDLDWTSPDTIAASDSSFVFVSRSWLEGFDTSSSNWLISPAMQITDASATLHWKSSSYQGPRYMDGYSVKILVGSQDITSPNTTIETVFRAAEMTNILFGDGSTVDLDSFAFSDGYLHADGYTLTDYFIPADTSIGEDLHIGKLEPHSVSLAAYEGQTIYVAWHHDSSDDNLMMLDDLLLMGTTPLSGTTDHQLADLRFVTYPNPVDNYLNVMFRLTTPADVQLQIFSQDGKMVADKADRKAVTGDFTDQFDLRNLPVGSYSVVLTVDNQRFTKMVVRK